MKTVIFEVAKQRRCELVVRSPKNETEPMRGDGDGGTFSRFKNAQCLVDTADIWHFLICRFVEKDVKACPFSPICV